MSPELVLLGVRVLIALLLYSFLFALLFFLLRDLRSATRPGESLPAAFVAVVVGGEAQPGFRLAETNLIGRAADNTIRIEDGTVSAYHVRISFQGGQWWLEDLGSRNGTALNDLVVDQPTVVTYGDRIRMGRVELTLSSGELAGDSL